MAKAIFGEFAAFTTRNMVRYQKNNRLIGEKLIPPEVVAYLNKQLGYTPKPAEPKPEPRFPMPTEEEKQRLREESLKVPPELAMTPEEVAQAEARTVIPVEEPLTLEEPLTPADFDDVDEDEPERDDPAETQIEDIPSPFTPEPTPAKPPLTLGVDPDFLETVSIHTAPLQDIAEALYSRFGIYSVYLDKLPETDEINPLTGEMFTKYHQGIAYQAAIKAKATGLLNKSAEEGRRSIDAGRAAHKNLGMDTPPQTMGDARRADSFAYRTSVQGNQTVARTEVVHETGADGVVRAVQKEIPEGELGSFNGAQSKYDADEDQPLVTPRFGKKVIRPNW